MKHSLVTYLPVLLFLGLISTASLVSFPYTLWAYLTNLRAAYSVTLSGHFLNWAPIVIPPLVLLLFFYSWPYLQKIRSIFGYISLSFLITLGLYVVCRLWSDLFAMLITCANDCTVDWQDVERFYSHNSLTIGVGGAISFGWLFACWVVTIYRSFQIFQRNIED